MNIIITTRVQCANMSVISEVCLGCGTNTQLDRHRRRLQSESSQHIIPLWSHIFNLELQKGESGSRASGLVRAGAKLCRKFFNAYEKCTKLIDTLRASIAKVEDMLELHEADTESENNTVMLPPPPKRVAVCVGPSGASPEVTVYTEIGLLS